MIRQILSGAAIAALMAVAAGCGEPQECFIVTPDHGGPDTITIVIPGAVERPEPIKARTGGADMGNLSIESAPDFAQYGAGNCVVVSTSSLHKAYEAYEIWEFARSNDAFISGKPQDEADDGPSVVVRFDGQPAQAFHFDQLVARLFSNRDRRRARS